MDWLDELLVVAGQELEGLTHAQPSLGGARASSSSLTTLNPLRPEGLETSDGDVLEAMLELLGPEAPPAVPGDQPPGLQLPWLTPAAALCDAETTVGLAPGCAWAGAPPALHATLHGRQLQVQGLTVEAGGMEGALLLAAVVEGGRATKGGGMM
jgi:hypothetical protein